MTFGDFLKRKRISLKMSQEEFADELGVHQQTVCRWETRKSSPPIDVATDIIESLGGEISVFYGHEV